MFILEIWYFFIFRIYLPTINLKWQFLSYQKSNWIELCFCQWNDKLAHFVKYIYIWMSSHGYGIFYRKYIDIVPYMTYCVYVDRYFMFGWLILDNIILTIDCFRILKITISNLHININSRYTACSVSQLRKYYFNEQNMYLPLAD